jgi:hypothetical protein
MPIKWLPIGSVVLLEDGVKPIMIYGRKQAQVDAELCWDYIACPYPEGNLDPEHTYLFNNENIDKVLFVGFQTPQEFDLVDYIESLDVQGSA